jgi:TolB protein
MDYDGNNARPLTAIGDLAIEPAFSPDGQKVAYVTWRSGQVSIEIITLSNGRRAPFDQAQGVTNHTPAWSPDSSMLAYSSGHGADIIVADWNGKGSRRITQTPTSDFSPSWNPKTGKQIAFVSNRTGTPQIFIMESDGTNVRRILDEGGDMENPAWSPDGLFIAFAWQKARTGVYDIYLHEISTGRTVQLTQDSGRNERPTWAPDGKHLAFQSDRTGTTQIYSMLANGSQVRQLTTRGKNEGPTWSGYMP